MVSQQRKAWATLVIDGRACGARQECQLVIDLDDGVMTMHADKVMMFPTDRAGDGWIKFRDQHGNYLSSIHVGKVTRGHHVRFDK